MNRKAIMSRVLTALSALAGALCFASSASAIVADVGSQGFTVKHETAVNAAPDAVWKALVDVGSWWDMEHSYSRDGKSMTIEARPGGCFCEKLPNGGAVVHGTVIFVSPNSLLRLSSVLGPMQSSGLAGTLSWRIAADGAGSKLEMTYSVGGYFPMGFEKVAPAVNGVLGGQFARLKAFVETGNPAGPRL